MLYVLIIGFIILAIFRMPVAISLGFATILAIWFFSDISLAAVPHKMVNGIESYVFLAIPLFLLAGKLMNAGGITDRIFNFARVLVGGIKGGLAHANVMASIIFAWMSGSAVAAVGGLGEIELKAMKENGFRNISTSNRPINHPSDLAGLKIRTPENPAQIQTIKALGGIPTPLSFSELYTALIQGVVDGQENPLQNIWFGRLYESQKFIAKTHHIYNSVYITASKRLWDSLEKEDRELILYCVEQSSKWQLEYMKKLDIELEEKMKNEGVTFTYPDPEEFAQASESAYEEMYKILGENARRIVQAIRNID